MEFRKEIKVGKYKSRDIDSKKTGSRMIRRTQELGEGNPGRSPSSDS